MGKREGLREQVAGGEVVRESKHTLAYYSQVFVSQGMLFSPLSLPSRAPNFFPFQATPPLSVPFPLFFSPPLLSSSRSTVTHTLAIALTHNQGNEHQNS